VETLGSDATQSEVTLAEADVSVTSGKGALKGLKIGNPEGFATDSAFELGEISIDLDVESLGSDTIVVKDILIDAPQVTYEMTTSGGSNIQAIKENVDDFLKRHGGGKKEKDETTPDEQGEPEEPKAPKGDGKKVVIENLRIQGGKVNVSATFLGGKKVGAPLPGVHLKDLGKKEGGLTPEQVTAEILAALTNVTDQAVETLDIDALKKGVDEAVDKAGKALDDAADKAGKAVKDLFGK
jgi:hypothetical protein